ncbi:MAG: hypothetical protein R2836_01695 [Chitinophagales bacterium]
MAFKTHNGRTVYDGGGVDPDITTEVKPLTDITVSLLRKDLMFEYATLYKLKNAELRDGEDFRLSDAEYQDFVSWLQDKEYDYVTDSEELLKEFKETAEKEDYFDGVQDEFEALKTKVAHDKEKDLQKQKNEIRRFLEEEIVTRYFYREGAIKNGFVYDKEIKKALETLNDSKAYNDLLQAKQ